MRLKALLVTAIALTAAASTTSSAAANPLHLIGVIHVDFRLEQLQFRTPAVNGPTSVRILLPAGYKLHPKRHYPVLYLLHGAIDNYTAWTVKGDTEQITARYPVIVVMPDSGPSGGYTNWYNDGAGGPPEWETYHIDELIPWVDRHLRTLASRSHRAVAGLSMGGFGTMSYAARHPDTFAAAASFSGALDTNNLADIAVTPSSVFGPRATQEVRWRAHNPWDLAANLRGLNLTIRTGNGLPGGPYGGGDPVEIAVHQMNVSLHDRLQALGISSLWDDYGPGGHDWPYWERDLRETLPTLMAVFAHPKPAPSHFTFTAVEPRYAVYGWSVDIKRPALEFSTLHLTGRHGFKITGSGSAIVTTPPLGSHSRRVRLTVNDAHGRRTMTVAAPSSGRLSIMVYLGPTNRYQEFTPAADSSPRHSFTAVVRIDGVR